MKKNLHCKSSFSSRRMLTNTKNKIQTTTLLLLLVFLGTIYASAQEIQESAIRQIKSLMDEKESRTPAQKKINSQILYASKMQNGQRLTPDVGLLQVGVEKDAEGRIKVNLDATVSPQLLNDLEALGCEISFSSVKFSNIVANIPLEKVEQVAMLAAVRHINPWKAPVLNNDFSNLLRVDPKILNTGKKKYDNSVSYFQYKPGFDSRAEKVKKQLAEALGQKELSGTMSLSSYISSAISQGDVAHKAALARAVFGTNGSGVKIGVISDSYDTRTTGTHASDDIVSGDLPGPGNPNGFTTPVTVLLDYPGGSDEGRAMLQIVHDLAPGAELYFASAFVSQASFAQQILDLREAGCDIIVDDISYYDEGVFQDDIIAQAVNTVTASGALYFSSAGNSGNKNDNTAGVWEGDFLNSGVSTVGTVTLTGGTLHDFGGGITYNQITLAATAPILKWSDPLGASGNDYDLYLLNSALTSVILASTDIQDGNDNPVEALYYNIPAGYRIVILQKTGAAVRALHVNTNRGRLNFNTPGVMYGHNAAASAYTVAASPAVSPGPYPGAFNTTNSVETFSSDGPRRIFFNPDGSEITPGNLLFGTNGGTLLQKPDITAADGVATTLPGTSGLNPFYGTSAAAPHAAAIAALIKSKLPALTPVEIRAALTSTAIDIETPGVDRDAGSGIIMAYEALLAAGAIPSFSNLEVGAVTANEGAYGNGNGTLESGELGSMTVQLNNISSVTSTDVNAVLTSSTPGVTITQGTASYGNIAGSGGIVNTATPYLFGLNSSIPCGTLINFTLTVSIGSGESSPKEFTFTVNTGSIPGTINATLGSAPPTSSKYVSGSGIQFNRLNRNGIIPTCAAAKATPTLQEGLPGGSRAYHSYTFTNTNSSSQCVSVSIGSATATSIYEVVYGNGGYIPSAIQSNYLADQGTTNNISAFSFNAPAGEQFTVVVHEVTVGGGIGTSYNLNVDLKSCDAPIACTPVIITTASLLNGIANAPYNQSFSATGGSGSYLFSLSGALPDGLNFSGNTLSGTATQTGIFPITVTATDATGCPAGSQDYNLNIKDATTTTIESNLNPSITGNTVAFTATVTSNGNPVTLGNVTFTEGITILASNIAVNSSGQASFLTSSLAAGNHDIKATYAGTLGFASSDGTITQIVNDPVITYNITTTAGAGGSITASSTVNSGENATVTVTPDPCYHIVSVSVDGVLADLSGNNLNLPYDVIFNNVTANHTVDATFAIDTYTITAYAGTGGSISPEVVANVACGDGTWLYTITPDACYSIADVLVDGVSIGAVNSYTFTYVNANHTISATFSQLTYSIVASAGANGSITPNVSTTVNCGDDQTFIIAANIGYVVQDLLVDGISQGAIPTYTFTNVTTAHTISASFIPTAVCSATGNITYQVWNNIGSSTKVSSLTSNINYPYNPTTSVPITSMEAPINQADNFGSRIAGYICAPTTGSYTFWIASNNEGELWLSSDDQPSNKQKIAFHTDFTNFREWNKFPSQKSVVINLTQGKSYYIEALMKESNNNDNLSVGWLKPGQLGTAPSEVVPGSVLSPLQVSPPVILVTSVSLPAVSNVNIGSSILLTATVLPVTASNSVLDWTTSNPAIATVNSSGMVSGIAAGAVSITATSTDGSNKSGTCLVTVNEPPVVCSATGEINYQVWNIPGTSTKVSSLTSNVNYPDNPSSSTLISSMEAPLNHGDNFGARITGYICAPATGGYSFWIASNNEGELWLSLDDQPANKQKIAYHTDFTGSREWNKYTTQKSVVIYLTQGKRYYIEALMKEYNNNDNFVVGWLKPGQSGTVPSEVIPGSVLSPFITAPPAILVSSVSLPATSSVNAGSSVLLLATVLPANATNNVLNWTTSNPAIAMVNSNGLVTGVVAGTVNITATSTDGSNTSGICVVTVNNIPVVCTATGNITYQVWNNIGNSTKVSSLTSNVNYPDNPTSSTQLTSMEAPINQADNFGTRIAGFICAPATGSYTFWIASNNEGELWLSSDDQPANKQKIAFHTDFTNFREWNKFPSQKSVVITLVQGKSYYIEALMKEFNNNDNLSVGWLKPGQSGAVPSEVIPGSVLSPLPVPAKSSEAKPENPDLAEANVELSVYPNPLMNDAVNIRLDNLSSDATLRIFTISGVQCYEGIIQSSGTIQVDRSVFKSGMYIIKVENEHFVKTTKLVVN